ncbi:hypothetical protein [Streptomyces arenae]|uniref:hypothetical protein n=1 Tax=Streptomyces arenae TaxID=29301 RepID=UPI00265B1696|nr:hypothetical protein [Streptomyces arenae]MCG7206851.1 hypothetical protein [Streptomyces arenae]
MEQRIGANSQPLEGAGFDPAFVPGLTSPAPAEPQDAEPRDAGAADAEVKAADAKAAEVQAVEVEAVEAEEADAVGPKAEDAADDDEAEPAEGPVFEAADRRARIVADATGVRLSLDEEKCEFRWDEIGAVETETPRFGKRFTITVHTPDRRWYPIEIEATARSRFTEWEEQLDAVLDAYFDEGADASDDDTDTDAEEARA